MLLQMVEQLLARGADVDATNEDGQTPLHYAALCEHQEVSAVTCKQRANCERAWLLAWSKPDVVQGSVALQICLVLLHAGADPSLRDSEGRRPQDVDASSGAWAIWDDRNSS